MTKREELEVFLERADEFISSKYILADIKIVNLLKCIASSDTLIALFKNCLTDFDYEGAKKKYLVKSKYLGEDKGEFVLPSSSRELLAFIFNILVDMDSNRINLTDFINRYFYVDGSYASGYEAFINAMIKPFKNSVKMLMEKVIEGTLEDPLDAITKEEERKAKEKQEEEIRKKQEEEILSKTYGESLKEIKELLLKDKQNVKSSKLSEDIQEEITLCIDMLANVVMSEDKDAINYAYVAYKYVAKAHPVLFRGRNKKISKLLKDIVNGL